MRRSARGLRVPISPLRAARSFGLGVALLAAAPAAAQITNGGFEAGPLFGTPSGWTAGYRTRVEVLRATDFSVSSGANNIVAPEGSQFVLLSTRSNSGTTYQLDGNGTADYDPTSLSQDFDAGAGGTVLSFSWAFMTSEASQPTTFDDFFRVSLDGSVILSGSVRKPGGVSPFPDTPPFSPTSAYDGTDYVVSSTGATNGTSLTGPSRDGFSGWNAFSILVAPGTHTLEFLVADQGDNGYDSALLIDNVRTVGGQSLFQVTSTSGSRVEAKNGAIVWRPHQTTRLAIAGDASRWVFTSTGDWDDNPNAQEQVFVSDGVTHERLTSMVDGTTSRPSISHTGKWVAYSATDDPLGDNGDGSQEIFLRDLDAVTPVQLTQAPASCASSNPTVGVAGAQPRVAFETTCALAGAPNSNGNPQIALWNGTGFSSPPPGDTSGCSSRSPDLSADGAWVAFVSTCDHTGGNGDGNAEVFLWQVGTPNVTQVSDTTGVAVDGASVSGDGGRVALISNLDLSAANAPLPTYEAFLWQRSDESFHRLTTSGLQLNIVARIDDSGDYVAVERLDLLGGPSEVVLLGVANPSSPGLSTIATGATVALPDVGLDGWSSEAVVMLQSWDDLLPGSNADGNPEAFSSRLVVDTPYVACSSPNLAIPYSTNNNNWSAGDTITSSLAGTVADVNVYLKVDHDNVYDLRARLVKGGTNRLLIDRPQVVGGGACTGDDIDATLDDDGPRPLELECSATPPAIQSPPSFTPTQTLSNFNGLAAAGDWRLEIHDRANNGISGTLLQWCIVLRND